MDIGPAVRQSSHLTCEENWFRIINGKMFNFYWVHYTTWHSETKGSVYKCLEAYEGSLCRHAWSSETTF